ncbi:MAG: hypothetical protein EKK57_11305 [Proteobacteria bacterium]|nr:MAG: hypothetical protein EKK57_11305 [Pseudomonadota bacterium]
MKKSRLLKNIFLIGLLCGSVNAFAAASYWPESFPKLGSDYRFNRMNAETLLNYSICNPSKANAWNPDYGTPIFKLSYNLILNVQNANDKLRYDVYSKYDGKYIYKNVALKNGKNVISILPTFLNHDDSLKDESGDYVIRVKGIKYNQTYSNSSINLNLSIKDTMKRGLVFDGEYPDDHIFYKNAKLEAKISMYRPAFTNINAVLPDSPSAALSRVIKSGDADPKTMLTCTVVPVNASDLGGITMYRSQGVTRFYASLDAYQIDMSGTMANYANPHMDTSSVAYFKDTVSYDLNKILLSVW